jgi:hypothetical protein
MFVPITLLAFGVLVPVNWTGETLENIDDLTFSNVDKLSISNVPPGSPSFLFYQLRRLEVSWFQVLGTYNYDIRDYILDLLHIIYGI